MTHSFLFYHYDEPLDFTGQNLVGLSGSPRDDVKRLIPSLVAPSEMEARTATTDALTAYNGELADEVHEFSKATQGSFKLKKVLLKQGNVIEVMFGW